MKIRGSVRTRGFMPRFQNFLNERGFYLVLLICVLVVGATGVNMLMNSRGGSTDNYLLDEEMMTPQVNASDSTPPPQGDEVKPTPAQPDVTVVQKTEDPSANEDRAQPVSQAEVHMIRPVFGDAGMGFAQDKMIYSKTLQEWTTHPGIDILCEQGTPVKAATDGKITDIKQDPRYGLTIIIEHPGEVQTVYSNLSTLDMIEVDQEVTRGEVISGAGSTAAFESEDGPHLHFEVLKDGEYMDPEEFLK